MLGFNSSLDFLSRMSKRDRDLANSNNHVEALEDEIRNLSTKMSKLEQVQLWLEIDGYFKSVFLIVYYINLTEKKKQ